MSFFSLLIWCTNYLIPVGKNNRFGHPKDEVLDNLNHAKLYRDDIDEKLLVEINEDLVAELIINNQTINIKQFGAKGNGTDDDTAVLNYAFSLNKNIVKKIILNEKYLITSSLNIPSNKDIIGVKSNLQYNEDILILTNNDIVMLNMDGISNTKISNIILFHICF